MKMGFLQIGTTYRYARPYTDLSEVRDGLPNFFANTVGQGPKPLLEKGISPIAACNSKDGSRTPEILISSSPHKAGTAGTPWHDKFDAETGFIRYFGDGKSEMPAAKSSGNKAIIKQFELHNSDDRRKRICATPFLFFERVTVDSRPKGNIRFWGLGVIQGAQLITQHQKNIGEFKNYVFEFFALDMTEDKNYLNWDWINARRNEGLSNEKSLLLAPAAWKKWVEDGEIYARKKV